jgi:hypothetical protein
MPKASKKDRNMLIMFFSAAAIILFLAVNPLTLNLPWMPTPQDQVLQFPNGANGANNSPVPDANSNTQITLTITPNIVNREQNSQVSITSSLHSVYVQLQVMYVGVSGWQTLTSVKVDANGAFNQQVQMNWAGVWKAKAVYGAAESNTVDLTVYGLTLYQSKSTWYVGESYTAALTGTYNNWVVYVYIKDAASDTWFYALNAQTDLHGMINPGANSVQITPAQINMDRNVIALICTHDQTGSQFNGLFEMVQGISMATTQQINQYAAQGQIVKSNVLTVSIR